MADQPEYVELARFGRVGGSATNADDNVVGQCLGLVPFVDDLDQTSVAAPLEGPGKILGDVEVASPARRLEVPSTYLQTERKVLDAPLDQLTQLVRTPRVRVMGE